MKDFCITYVMWKFFVVKRSIFDVAVVYLNDKGKIIINILDS